MFAVIPVGTGFQVTKHGVPVADPHTHAVEMYSTQAEAEAAMDVLLKQLFD